MIDHRDFFLVSYLCDSGVKSVERVYVVDVGGILHTDYFHLRTIRFLHALVSNNLVLYNMWVRRTLTFPHELIGSGHTVLPQKRAPIGTIEENWLCVFINTKISQNQQGGPYSHNNDFARFHRLECCLHTHK